MAGRRWTVKEINFIIENINHMTFDNMAICLNRTTRAILHICDNLKLRKRQEIELGSKFNRLKLIEKFIINKYGQNMTMGKFQCDCGNFIINKLTSVLSGHVKSCGCLLSDKARETCIKRNTINSHRLSRHPLYRIWANIKSRCYNSKTKMFKWYGGRGISMCNEWKNDFKLFYNWCINNNYQQGLTLDRINNDLGYYPSNCKWVTYYEQAHNRSSNIHVNITAFGETKTSYEWINDSRCVVNHACLIYRIGAGWQPEKAITQQSFRSKN